MLALAALVVSNGFLIATATSSESNEAFSDCIQECIQTDTRERSYCIRDCMARHLPSMR
jgi:hypothetical protein